MRGRGLTGCHLVAVGGHRPDPQFPEKGAALGHHLACAHKTAEAKACFERAAACATGLSEKAWAERLLKAAESSRQGGRIKSGGGGEAQAAG